MTPFKEKCNECGEVASIIDNKTLYCAKHYLIKKGYQDESSADIRKKKQTKNI